MARSIRELADELYVEQTPEARRMSPSDKLTLGGILFEEACQRMREASARSSRMLITRRSSESCARGWRLPTNWSSARGRLTYCNSTMPLFLDALI
jgi:hypothetical protein